MEREYGRLNYQSLETLYEVEMRALESRLLEGADWEEVIDLRKRITTIGSTMYKMRNGLIPISHLSSGHTKPRGLDRSA